MVMKLVSVFKPHPNPRAMEAQLAVKQQTDSVPSFIKDLYSVFTQLESEPGAVVDRFQARYDALSNSISDDSLSSLDESLDEELEFLANDGEIPLVHVSLLQYMLHLLSNH